MRRRLTIRTKLAAALAVPLTMLTAFAALQVRSAYYAADRIKLQARLANSATGPGGAINVLVNERDYVSLSIIGRADLVVTAKTTFEETKGRTNLALGAFRDQLAHLGRDVSGNYSAALGLVSSQLEKVRSDASKFAAKPSLANAKNAGDVFDEYGRLIDQLLHADQQSALQIDDAQLRTGAELMNTITHQNDVESRILIETAFASFARDSESAQTVPQLFGIHTDLESQLNLHAVGAYSRAIAGALASTKRAGAIAALQAAANDPMHVDVNELFRHVPQSARVPRVLSNVTGVVLERTSKLTSDAQTREAQYVGIAIGSVLIALLLLRLTNRWITRPLRDLADQAGAVASVRLPAAVREILDTPVAQQVVHPELEPVHVRAGGEVGEVRDALNRVQASAVDLAVEQAQLRRNVADAYVNLGRRNQNLLSRQLEFISQLENDESDPDTLEHLFRLDHLATRMRRNAESLLVIAGHEAPRTWSAPVEISDVVRGAFGEVEGYQRARLRHLDTALVNGGVAADVSHVVAELVENALNFSPPDSDVEVYGRRDDFGYVVTIIDSGLGMSAADLESANALFSGVASQRLEASRYLGHYVVAQLAVRHGLGVHLAASPAGGITATIALPAAVLGGTEPAEAEVEPAEAVAEIPALPRRVALVQPEPEPEPEPQPQPLALVAPDPELPALPESEVLPLGLVAAAFGTEPEPAVVAPVEPEPEPAPEPEQEPTPDPEPEPEAAPRPRLGLGTFADLRSTPVTPVVNAPVHDPAGVPEHPELEAVPDRQASYAEVADAVQAATGRPPVDPADVPDSSQDLLPHKLPKRGRRASRLQKPWTREKPSKHAEAPVPLPAATAQHPGSVVSPRPPANAAPELPPTTFDPAAAHIAPPAAHATDADGAAAVTGAVDQQHAPEGGDDRFAFFAAFRAAAERAREEAGIDDRRVGR